MGGLLRLPSCAGAGMLDAVDGTEDVAMKSEQSDQTAIRLEQAKAVFLAEITSLQQVAERLDGNFVAAVELLRETIGRAGKIIVVGVGKSENVASKIVATFNSTAAPSVLLNSQNALHGDIGVVTAGDVVLALSYSGETNELLNILPYLKQRAEKIISMTGRMDSTLAGSSDLVLDIGVQSEACPLALAPTSSTTSMLAMGDALAMVLIQARGFTAAEFAEQHPNGHLGRRLLTKVTDIMRSGEQLALAGPGDSVEAALKAMTRCKAGAVVVTEEDGKLAGIFTHGDFVREYQRNRMVAEAAVGDHMTRSPICLVGDELATEALKVLEENPIDDLVVVDAEGRVIGLIDVQDLTRAHIL